MCVHVRDVCLIFLTYFDCQMVVSGVAKTKPRKEDTDVCVLCKYMHVCAFGGDCNRDWVFVRVLCCCCNKLPLISWLKATRLYYIIIPEGRKFDMGQQACILSRGSGGRSVFLPLPASEGRLHASAHGLILHFRASILAFSSLSLTVALLSSSYKDPCDYRGPPG